MHYKRIAIEVLTPHSAGKPVCAESIDERIAFQWPISDWMQDVREWYDALNFLIARHPIEQLGLIYGLQGKDDEKPLDFESELAKLRSLKRDEVMPYFEAQIQRRKDHLAEMVKRRDEFIENFPHLLYRVQHGIAVMGGSGA